MCVSLLFSIPAVGEVYLRYRSAKTFSCRHTEIDRSSVLSHPVTETWHQVKESCHYPGLLQSSWENGSFFLNHLHDSAMVEPGPPTQWHSRQAPLPLAAMSFGLGLRQIAENCWEWLKSRPYIWPTGPNILLTKQHKFVCFDDFPTKVKVIKVRFHRL